MSKLTKIIRKVKKRPSCSAVIVAAGSSVRAGQDKLFSDLNGMPVLARTLMVFEDCECIDEIVLVTREDKIVEVAQLCRSYGISKATKVICGGETRLHSALAGISETNPEAACIAIHDGARPLVTEELVEKVVHAAVLHKAAVPYLPVKDTLKSREEDKIVGTLPRENTITVQTPQVFHADLIKVALTSAVKSGMSVTDDSSAVESLGAQVHLVTGDEANIKLTTPIDFVLAEALLEARRSK